MNWTLIIQALLDSGMSQAQIAEACDTGQSHISGLYRGERKQPNWRLGDRLLALHRERVGAAGISTSTVRIARIVARRASRETRKGGLK